jgi:ATP-binding cassette subfamily B (MDR/TAP) protein 1
MGVSFSAPLIKVLKEGQVAAYLAFKVIDHVPGINQDDKKAKEVLRESMSGKIEFKDVDFAYPSKKDQKVLKSFSCVFEAGKTTALVGPSGSGKSTII